VVITEGIHGGGADESELAMGRYDRLRKFAKGWKDVSMWAGDHGWLETRIEDLRGEGEVKVTMMIPCPCRYDKEQ